VDLERHLGNDSQAGTTGAVHNTINLEEFPLADFLQALKNAGRIPE
jgi:hypothetical protein